MYIYGSLDECLECLARLDTELENLIERSIELKDRAMLWIFAVQWLVVSGASMITGFLLWTSMVRRKLYSEVRTTRLLRGN